MPCETPGREHSDTLAAPRMTASDTARSAESPTLAGLWPRFGAIVYDGLLVFGIAFIASWVFVVLSGDASQGVHRRVHQLYLAVVLGAYFVACWRWSGQTLAMKTWGLRVVKSDGGRMTLPQAVIRYLLALVFLIGAAAGFLWAFVDRDRQFLHDRLLGTRIIRAPI